MKLAYNAQFFLLIFIALLSSFVIWPYITPLFFAAIIAYFSYPAYLYLNDRFSKTISSIIVCSFFLIVAAYMFNYGINIGINEIWNIYINSSVKTQGMSSTTQEIVRFIATNSIEYLSNLASKIPLFFLSSFIFFISLFYFLKDGQTLYSWIKDTLPIPARNKMQILNSIKQNVDAFVYVTLFIGLIQAVVAGIGFFLFNIPYPILGGMIAGVLSLLPIVGPYFLYVVVGLLLLSSSQVNIAIGIIVYGLLIGSLLDYSLRPVMMSKKAKLHPMIIFIGIFGGMSIMGIIGIVIGPIILSIGYAFFKDLEITSK
tara:strand:- start:348 stop:1289 length:942 start_codon:yes stop_codon:yes gene_type:complete